jgi:LPXTG-site transpeptidase (sortase) family protein
MNSQKRKMAALFLWGGAVLIVVGIVLSYARLIPFIETALYSRQIPTAPPLLLPSESTPDALLPSGAGDDASGAAAAPLETETPFVDEPASTTLPAETLPTETPAPTLAPTHTPEPTVEVTATTAPTATGAPTRTVAPTPAPTSTPQPILQPTPAPRGVLPQNITIPDIRLDAPVVPIGWKIERIDGQNQAIWDVPNWHAAGWHNTSATVGVTGNTVFNGHNTLNGEVFRDLYKLEVGADIFVEGADGVTYAYRVGEKYILREAGQPLSVRLENARYIQETPDNRLTLVTCHPYGSLANRLIVIAYPLPEGQVQIPERME